MQGFSTSQDKELYIFVIILVLFLILFFAIDGIMSIYDRHKLKIRRLSQSDLQNIDRMDGTDFAHYLELLFKKQGYQVRRTSSSDHFLILERKERIVVQIKPFKNNVGIRSVQEINRARDHWMAQKAWIITNNFFTAQAINFAEATDIRLIDRYELFDIVMYDKYHLK